jgi:signal transduction histidine kinase
MVENGAATVTPVTGSAGSSIADAPEGSGSAVEPSSPVRRRPWLVWVLPFFFWSLPALLVTKMTMETTGLGFGRAFLREGVGWFLWAFATPGILALARRFPLDGPRVGRTLLVHVAAGLSMGALMGAVTLGLSVLAGTTIGPSGDLTVATAVRSTCIWACFGLLFYAATSSVGVAMDYQRKLREREVAASRLEAQLVEARLNALRMQLQPHFLFNALNTVSMLVRQGDASTAVRVVARLSDLLRYVLDGATGALVPLRTEVDFVARYLEIEQLRFGDRLDVRIDVDDDAADLPVPGLLLQPVVENAIRHGIAARAAAGCVTLDARILAGRLIIRLRDDGPGFDGNGHPEGPGIGLRNTRARLRYLYGEAAELRTGSVDGRGAEVTIALPLRPDRHG